MKAKRTSKLKRGANERAKARSQQRVGSQRRELNLDDKQALFEAADDLKSQGNLRLLMEDDTEETWAILMGAKALEKLANESRAVTAHED